LVNTGDPARVAVTPRLCRGQAVGTFTFVDLDGFTRRLMVEELDCDPDGLTMSTCFTPRGRADYPRLLREAMQHGDAESLIAELQQLDRMKPTPVNAAERFGGTEFNRYYSRAVCRRALIHGSTTVVVYRARHSASPRERSENLIGGMLPATTVLDDLRTNRVDGVLGVAQVSSGLSLRCGCAQCLRLDA
jgi:hypothetical protein